MQAKPAGPPEILACNPGDRRPTKRRRYFVADEQLYPATLA